MGDELVFRVDRFEALMKQRGLGPGELAYLSNVSYDMIYKVRKGERTNVSAIIAVKLARALGTHVEFLVDVPADVVGEERAAYSPGSPLEEKQRAILAFFESLSEDEQAFVLELVAFVRQRNTPGCDEAKRRRGEDGGFVGTDG